MSPLSQRDINQFYSRAKLKDEASAAKREPYPGWEPCYSWVCHTGTNNSTPPNTAVRMCISLGYWPQRKQHGFLLLLSFYLASNYITNLLGTKGAQLQVELALRRTMCECVPGVPALLIDANQKGGSFRRMDLPAHSLQAVVWGLWDKGTEPWAWYMGLPSPYRVWQQQLMMEQLWGNQSKSRFPCRNCWCPLRQLAGGFLFLFLF